MLNIITHILDIGANCTCEYIGQEHQLKLINFIDIILKNLLSHKPYYNTILLLVAKLFSKLISNQNTR